MVRSETTFIEELRRELKTLLNSVYILTNSNRERPYNAVINSINYELKQSQCTAIMAYEVVINNNDRSYPDFFVKHKDGRTITIEVKNSQHEKIIASHINTIDKYNTDEYWVVIQSKKDHYKILSHIRNKDTNIKVLKLETFYNKFKRWLA